MNVDPRTGSGIGVTNYLQKIRGGLALGGEFMLQSQGGMVAPGISLGGRYKTPYVDASAAGRRKNIR